jgi:NitT/TauT family transport system substrate-binding protein
MPIGTRLLLFVAVLLPACGAEETEKRTVKIGYMPIADCAHLFVAVDQALFAKHGLQVEAVMLPGGPRILEALAGGAIDVGYSGVVPALAARGAGLPLQFVGGAVVEDAEHAPHRLLVPVSSAMAGPADLAGKRVAINTLRGIDQLVLSEYAQRAGADPATMQLREVAFPRMEGVLHSAEVDAAMAIEPYVSAATAAGTVRALANAYTEVAPRTFVAAYVMKADAAGGQVGNDVRAVLAGATTYMETHPAETRASVAAHTKLDPRVVGNMAMARFEAMPAAADVQAMIDRTTAMGLLDKAPTAAEMLPP